MKVIIPMAGYGTRLRPHTFSKPKPLINVAGKPVLGHVLDMLAGVAVEVIVGVGVVLGVCVGVGVAVGVAVSVGVRVGVGLGVEVELGVNVGRGVGL